MEVQIKNKTAVLDKALVKANLENHQTLMDAKEGKKPEENKLQVKFKTAKIITDSNRSSPQMAFNMKQQVDGDEIQSMLQNIGKSKERSNSKVKNTVLAPMISQDQRIDPHDPVIKEFKESLKKIELEKEEKEAKNFFNQKESNKTPPRKRTFDNRIVDDFTQGSEELYPSRFDFQKYQFYQSDQEKWKINEFQKQFVFGKNNNKNKQLIWKNMIELVAMNASKHLDENTQTHPFIMEGNRDQWLQLLLKSPKMQKFFDHFNHELRNIMQAEMENNKTNFDLFMTHPRPPKGNICNLYSTKKFESKDEGRREQRMINKSIDSAKHKYNYKLEKQKLINQMRYGKNKSQKATQDNEVEMPQVSKKQKQNKKNEQIVIVNEKDNQEREQNKQQDQDQEPEQEQEQEQEKKQVKEEIKVKQPKTKERPKIYSDFQMRLKGATKSIDELLEIIDDDNQEFKEEIDDCYKEMDSLKIERQFHALPKYPGNEIGQMLEQWDERNDRTVTSEQEMFDFTTELWLSLQQYEQQMRNQIKGHDLELAYRTRLHDIRMKDLQEKTVFQIEAYETAFAEMKIKQKQELEQQLMRNCELESQLMSANVTEGQQNQLISKCEEGLVLRNFSQAHEVINDLVLMTKRQQKQIRLLNIELETYDREIIINRENVDFEKQKAKVNETLRAFYQQILIKFVRDVDMFKDQPDILEKYQKINEYSYEVTDQQFYMQLLIDIDLKKKINDFANKHIGTSQHLEELSGLLDQLGINDEDDDINDIVSNAVKSPNPTAKKSNLLLRKGTFKVQKGGLSLEIDKLTKEKIQLLLRNSIQGFLESPIATMESGQPDYEKVERANHDFKVKEEKLKKTRTKGTPRRHPGEKSSSKKVTVGAGRAIRRTSTNKQNRFSSKNIVNKAGEKIEDKQDDSAISKAAKQEGGGAGSSFVESASLSASSKDTELKGKENQLETPELPNDPVTSKNLEDLEYVTLPELPSEMEQTEGDHKNTSTPKSGQQPSQQISFKTNSKMEKERSVKTSMVENKNSNESKLDNKTKTHKTSGSNHTVERRKSGLTGKEHRKKKSSQFFRLQNQINNGADESQASNSVSDQEEKNEQQKNKKIPPALRLNSGPMLHDLVAKGSTQIKAFRHKLSPTLLKDFDHLLQLWELQDLLEAPSELERSSNSYSVSEDKKEQQDDNEQVTRKLANKQMLRKISTSFKNIYDASKTKYKERRNSHSSQNYSIKDGEKSLSVSNTIDSVSIGSSDGAGDYSKQITMRAPVIKKPFAEAGLASQVKNGGNSVGTKSKAQKTANIKRDLKKNLNKKANVSGMDSQQIGTASRATPLRFSPPQDERSPMPTMSQLGGLEEDEWFEPNGLLLVDQTLNELTKDKFTNIKKETALQQLENEKVFKLNAKAIQEFNESIQLAMNETIGFDDNQRIISEPYVQKLFDIFNELQAKKFKFEETNTFIENKGQKDTLIILEEVPATDPKESLKLKKIKSKASKAQGDPKKAGPLIEFQDIIKPCINEQGEFLGVQLKTDLANSVFAQNNHDQALLKRILKVSSYINRMMQDGMEDDFALIQIKSGEMLKNRKEFQDKSTEIEEIYLEKNDEPVEGINTNTLLYKQLKEHAIDIIVRCNPKKRNYQNMMWENQKVDELYSYILPNVFMDSKQAQSGERGLGLEFGQYLSGLFTLLKKKMDTATFQDGQKEVISLERFVMLGLNQDDSDEGKAKNQECQATANMRDNDAQTQLREEMNGTAGQTAAEAIVQSHLPKPSTKMSRMNQKNAPKHQIILDKALEGQFDETLELFDVFVNSMAMVDARKFREADYIPKSTQEVSNQPETLEATPAQQSEESSQAYFLPVKVNGTSYNNKAVNSKSAKRRREGQLSRNQRSQANQKDDYTEDEFEVNPLKKGLTGTIAEIKADPHLINKFRVKYQEIVKSEAAGQDVPAISPVSMIKLARNQIDIESPNRITDLDRELQQIQLIPDAVGWEENAESRNQNPQQFFVPDRNFTMPNSNQYESTKNSFQDQEMMERSRHVLPMINTEKHDLRSFGSILNKKEQSSGAMNTMPSEFNTFSYEQTPTRRFDPMEKVFNMPTTGCPSRFAFESAGNIRDNLNRTALLGKTPKSQHFAADQFVQPMKVQVSNMNQTTNAFHSFAKIKDQKLDIINQEQYSHKRKGSNLNRSLHVSSNHKGFNQKGETLAQFVNRMDQSQVTVPQEILSKVINKKGKHIEWYNQQLSNRWKVINKEKIGAGDTIENLLLGETQIRQFEKYHGKSLQQSPVQRGMVSGIMPDMITGKSKKPKGSKARNNFSTLTNKGNKVALGHKTQTCNSPLRVSAIIDPQSPQGKIKNLQLKAKQASKIYFNYKTVGSVGSSDESGRDLAHTVKNSIGGFEMTPDGNNKPQEIQARINQPLKLVNKQQSTTTELDENLRIIFAKRYSRGSSTVQADSHGHTAQHKREVSQEEEILLTSGPVVGGKL